MAALLNANADREADRFSLRRQDSYHDVRERRRGWLAVFSTGSQLHTQFGNQLCCSYSFTYGLFQD